MSHWGLCQCHGIQGWELSQVQREGEEKDLQDFWELLIQEGLAETCRTQFADSSSGFFFVLVPFPDWSSALIPKSVLGLWQVSHVLESHEL